MNKITLEDVAEIQDVPRYAALVRAAAEVVEAGNRVCAYAGVIGEDGGQQVHVELINALADALAKFDQISEGRET